MARTIEDQREVSAYKEVMMSAFADFSGLDDTELRVGLGGARALLDTGGAEPAAGVRDGNDAA